MKTKSAECWRNDHRRCNGYTSLPLKPGDRCFCLCHKAKRKGKVAVGMNWPELFQHLRDVHGRPMEDAQVTVEFLEELHARLHAKGDGGHQH